MKHSTAKELYKYLRVSKAMNIHDQNQRTIIVEAIESYARSKREEARQQWISVDERLPENTGGNFSDIVIVCYDSGAISTARFDYEFSDWNILHKPKVTHWQPLPPPPEPSPTSRHCMNKSCGKPIPMEGYCCLECKDKSENK